MLFKATWPWAVLLFWLAIFGGGWINLKSLPHLIAWSTAATRHRFLAVVGLIWLIGAVVAGYLYYRVYRRGQFVAITTDGLIIMLFGFDGKLVLWSDVTAASVKPRRGDKAQTAFIELKSGKKQELGAVGRVFPTRAEVDRFVNEVNARIAPTAATPPSHTGPATRCRRTR
jgi:hypothetical protein